MTFRNLMLPGLTLLAASTLTAAPGGAQGAVDAGRFGDWTLSLAEGPNQKLCFAASQPREKEPAGANRAKTLFYVSAWPNEGVKSEISIKLGYPIKAGSEITVLVGKETFKLFPKEERAYVADATEELKLIEAMKKGSKLVVQASSERGTVTKDTYSLAGLAQALQAMATRCP